MSDEVRELQISIFTADGNLLVKSRWYEQSTGTEVSYFRRQFDGEYTFEFESNAGSYVSIGATLKRNCLMTITPRVVSKFT